MPRAKRGFKARRRRNKIMKAAKGFVGARGRIYRQAAATVHRAWRYSTRDRRVRKREFRALWIVRISAASRAIGVSYSKLIGWLKTSKVELDRKILADLAVHDLPAFKKIIESVRPS
jgi:large subunit ribosomal protein L20